MNQDTLSIDTKIEALLFFKGEPLTVKDLAGFLSLSETEIEAGLATLQEKLSNRGLQAIVHNGEVMLATHRLMGEFFETMRKDELTRELSKASLETLSIILYKDGATRADIDYIRGVNSSFILRNLLIRGLIQKGTDPKDSRKNLYSPTLDLLAFLGVNGVADLPNFETVAKTLIGESVSIDSENNSAL